MLAQPAPSYAVITVVATGPGTVVVVVEVEVEVTMGCLSINVQMDPAVCFELFDAP